MRIQCLVVLWLSIGVPVQAQHEPGGPLQRQLIAPELLLQHQVEIGLSEAQVRRIRERMQDAGPRAQQLQQRTRESMTRLADLLAKDEIDAEAARTQIDQFLHNEQEQKRRHLRTLLDIRSELTPAQRRAALAISAGRRGGSPSPPDMAARAAKRPKPRPIDATLSADGLSEGDAQAAFYRQDDVQTVQLTIAPENVQRLVNALPERIYVPAVFQWRDATFENVAVRYKGNSSSNPKQRHKRSFLVRFNEYEPSSRFFGLRRVSFDNGVQFGSLFSEPIITDILRDLGLPTHRCNYARIFLNDEYQGVYVNVERIDKSFVEHHWPDSGGALFKADIGGPGGNLQFVGDDPSLYERALEAKSDSAKRDRAKLVELLRDINDTQPDRAAEQLGSLIELDDFLHVASVMLFSGAFD
ncbi:MAG: CotH kinase family protein, partial [Planctomycetota bacterium]